MRLLDQAQYIQGLSDLTIPVEQLRSQKPAMTRVFITENEINGLCFPSIGSSMVIFGLGYCVDVLRAVTWLREKEIYYWGDLDTHGFAMLDQVRSFLPQTYSMLMEESTLFKYRDLWSVEDKPFQGQLTRLTPDEHCLLCSLQSNTWGKGVRLE
ncbi:Wadjet anti-phage system protein JetD domain-containing protein [Desulfosporosinus hippei]